MALEQGLDDGSTCRRATNAVLLHHAAQFLVVHQFSGCFHGTQQGGFGIVFGRRGHLLRQGGDVLATLAFREGRQRALFLLRFLLIVIRLRVLGIDSTPSWVEDGATSHLELYTIHIAKNSGLCKLAVGIEHADKPAGYQVIDLALHIRQVLWHDACGDDGVVIGHL